jgi:prepilin-type processing-associated H-X9-DG protein
MLLPALSKARAAAQAIKCTNNLKQVALFITMYANDYDDKVVPGCLSGSEYWWTILDGEGYEIDNMIYCPSSTNPPGYSAFAETMGNIGWETGVLGQTQFRVLTEAENPSKTPFMSDSYGYWKPIGGVHVFGSHIDASLFGEIYRHNSKTNVNFFDGHVGTVQQPRNTGFEEKKVEISASLSFKPWYWF